MSHAINALCAGLVRVQIGPQQYRNRYEVRVQTSDGSTVVTGHRDSAWEAEEQARTLVAMKAQFGRGSL